MNKPPITIPVVFASDGQGEILLATTLLSILKNKEERTAFDFYILVSADFNEKIKQNILALVQAHPDVKIQFVDMGDAFQSSVVTMHHITTPTYYRLLIPDLLPRHYHRALYLDIDIIVQSDLAELFQIDMHDHYLAGVIAAGSVLNPEVQAYHAEIGLKDNSNYINAGITLWNLDKMRAKEGLIDELVRLSKNNYPMQDQDVVNLAFAKEIEILPLKFNYVTKYSKVLLDRAPEYVAIYGEDKIQEALQHAHILHFAGADKPWNSYKVDYDDVWLSYALSTPYRDELQQKRCELNRKELFKCLKKFQFKRVLELLKPQPR